MVVIRATLLILMAPKRSRLAMLTLHLIFLASYLHLGCLASVLIDDTARYATVNIVKPEPVEPTASADTNSNATQPTVLTLDQKAEKLIDALDLPFTYYSINTCVYTKEIRDYIAGEWDGSDRTSDDYGGYNAARYVMSREYYWIASNLINGKSYSLSANVDYDGYKEVIPARSSNQSYSLAVSRITGEIEKWSFFEQQDA